MRLNKLVPFEQELGVGQRHEAAFVDAEEGTWRRWRRVGRPNELVYERST